MARKKIVYIIVEGPSDETALSAIFSKFFNPNEVRVEVMHTDITTEKGNTATNILARIASIVKSYANTYKLNAKDFLRIIHIVDTDGVYIPDDHVIKCETNSSPFYTLEHILTPNPEGIIARNKQKRDILDKLISSKCVWNIIPYQVFYMSCNMDHVLHNKMNSSDQVKEEDSHAFAMKYHTDIEGFLDFISESSFSVSGGYMDSWRFIKADLNSLQRHTNLCICLDKSLYITLSPDAPL